VSDLRRSLVFGVIGRCFLIAHAQHTLRIAAARFAANHATSGLTPRLKIVGHYVGIPRDAYPPILQGAIMMNNSRNALGARRFLDFLTSAAVLHQLEASGLNAAH
jgi:ABC-type molybdate transport system substrate-binding protein